MNIVDRKVVFIFWTGFRIIDNEPVFFLEKKCIEVIEFFDFVEENDDLDFRLLFGDVRKGVDDTFVFGSSLKVGKIMGNPLQTHIFVLWV